MKLPENHKRNCAIFDFDSTIVSIETLDFLIAKTAKDQKEVIEKITNLAMSGKMTFAESLKTRFSHIKLTKSDIEELKSEICNYITVGFLEGFNKIEQDFDFYIISGGFLEIIYPVAEKLRVKKENCFANNFVYKENKIIGFDETNTLSQNGGKPKIVEQILSKNSYNRIFMIGDGYTDLEVTKVNDKVTFCGFGMHAARDSVIKEAKNFFYSVDELIKFLECACNPDKELG